MKTLLVVSCFIFGASSLANDNGLCSAVKSMCDSFDFSSKEEVTSESEKNNICWDLQKECSSVLARTLQGN